jgi:hypothetical protein
MTSDRESLIRLLAMLCIAGLYLGGYLASVSRVQVSYGNPSGVLIAFYDHPWQRVLFSPIEQLDRTLFPARWRYN